MTLATFAFAVSATPPEILAAETVEHPYLRAMLDYWHGLFQGDELPLRPQATKSISRLLKDVFVCDVVDHGNNFRFRLLGDAVFQGLKENQSGRLVTDHPDMGIRARFPILMREVVRTRRAVRGLTTRVTTGGIVTVDSIWLPFGGQEVTQIMNLTVLSRPDPSFPH